MTDPREDVPILLDSNRLAERVLAADRAAATGREFYDDGFFAAFKREALPIVDRRVAEATSATAAFITGAWVKAGQARGAAQPQRSPRRVPKAAAPPPAR